MFAIAHSRSGHRLSLRWLIVLALALLFALCATPTAGVQSQEPTPAAAAQSDSTLPQQLTPEQLAAARREGEALGATRGGWFGRAFAVGFFTLYTGTAVIIPMAAAMEPTPPKDVQLRIAAKGPAYQTAFQQGYASKVRRKRVWTSVAGTVLGAATMVGMIAMSWDS